MKRQSLLGIALTTLVGGVASAADMSVYKAPQLPMWAPSWTAYTLEDVVSFHNTFSGDAFTPGHQSKSSVYQTTNGLTYNAAQYWTLGGGFIYTRTDSDLTYLGPGARSFADGVTGFGTTTFTLPNMFTFGASGGYGGSLIRQERFVPVAAATTVAALSNQDEQHWFVSGFVSKQLQYGNLYLTPTLRVLHKESMIDAYVENLGTFAPIVNGAQLSVLGEFSYGGQISYAMPTASGWTFYPTIELYGLYDYQLPLYQSSRSGLDLKAGVSATVANWSMGVAYLTILGIDAFHDYNGVRAFLSYKFGGESAPQSGVPLGVSSGAFGGFGRPGVYNN